MESLTSSATITRDIPEEDVVVVQLSEANKFRLFKETTDALASEDEESTNVLKRLDKLNKDVAKDFGKKEDAISRAPFRLIFSRDAPVVEDHSKDVPSYIVVSYGWHNPYWSPGNPQKWSPWPFCKDLAESILDLRDSNEEGIFIDHACIDQENAVEKAYAIASMNVVYRSARRMVILLEDVLITEAEEAVLAKFRTLILQGITDAEPDPTEKRTLATVFLKLTSSRWFSRAWCAHEMKVVRNWRDIHFTDQHTFRVYNDQGGIVRVPLLFFAWTQVITAKLLRTEPVAPLWDIMAQDSCYWKFSAMLEYSPVQQLPLVTDSVSVALQYARLSHLHCLIPSDRTNVALNVCGIGVYYKGSAETDDECWWVFILLALARGEVAVLTCVGPSLMLDKTNGANGPISWVRRPLGDYIFAELRIPITSTDTYIARAEPNWIELDLYHLNEPVNYSSTKFKEDAASIVKSTLTSEQREDRAVLRALQATAIPGPAPSGSQDGREDFLTQLVSVCLGLGTKWMLKVSENLRKAIEVDSTVRNTLLNADDSMHPLARVLLSRDGITESNTPSFVSDHLIPISQLLFMLAHDLASFVSKQPTIIKVASRSGHHAFTKAVFYPQKHVLAVPVGLADNQFSLLIGRVWVLERVDFDTGHWPISNPVPWTLKRNAMKDPPTQPVTLSDFHRPFFSSPDDPGKDTMEGKTAWRIVDKAPLFGCDSIKADGKSITLLTRQRVWGSEIWHDKKLMPESID